MVDYTDQFILNTNLSWDSVGGVVDQLRGQTFGVDGFATGSYVAESTTAITHENTANDGSIDDLNGDPQAQDSITVAEGATLGSASGALDYVVGIREYEITLTDGTVLTQADFNGHQFPVRVLDSSTGNKVLLDLSDEMLSTLNQMPQIASISFPSNATQQADYGGYIRQDFDDAYTPVCFTSGTLIETADGQSPVETLKVGDTIRTMDSGYQRIRWIGATKFSKTELAGNPKLLPVRIKAGALGQGLPERDLIVSRQHKVLVRSKIAQRIFGTMEILVPANKLVGYEGVEIADDIETVTYWHILFDRHEVIFAEGTPTESLYTGPEAIKNVSPEARLEIETLFPELIGPNSVAEPARFIPAKGAAIRKFVERHAKNGKALFDLMP